MVKIPTYNQQTRAKAPISRSRPMIANSGADKVYAEMANLADTYSEIALEVKKKNQKIADERKKIEIQDRYIKETKPIFDQYSTSTDVKNGATNYANDVKGVSNNIYEEIKTEYPALSEYFNTWSAENSRSNYVSIDNKILSNNRKQGEQDLIDKENLLTNQWLGFYFEGNSVGIMQVEDQLYGNNEKSIKGTFDLRNELGLDLGTITKEQYNDNLQNNILLLSATKLIDENINRFNKNYDMGLYNTLDPAKLIALKARADSKIATGNNRGKTDLKDNAKIIKQEIKELLDITKGDQFPDTVKLDDVSVRALAIHEALIQFPGEVGLRKELLSLQNAVSVIAHTAPFRQLPLNDVNEEFNNIQTALRVNEGQGFIKYINAAGKEIEMSTQQAINTRDAFEKLITYRNSNADNLIKVAIDSGVQYGGNAIPQIEDWAEVTAEELAVRGALGSHIQTMYDANEPQYFTEIDKTSIKNIWNSGNKDDIQKAISSVIFMAGADNAPIAFNQLGDGYEGIAHIGTLQAINGGSTIELDNALDALVQLRTAETQDRFKRFSLAENSDNYIGSEVQQLMEARIGAFVDNTYAQDINLYRQLKNSTQLIAYGMVINNPEFSELRFEKDKLPLDDKDVVKMFDTALNIAAGYHNGFGGITSYNDHSLILPEWFPNSKNPADTDGDLDFVLSQIMTDELFELATSIEVSGNLANLQKNRIVEHVPNEFQDNDVSDFIKREIPANEIFGVNELGLYSVEPGKYIMTFGDPRFAQEGYTNSEGQLVILDLNRIKTYIDAYLDNPELANKQKLDRIKSNISEGGDLF